MVPGPVGEVAPDVLGPGAAPDQGLDHGEERWPVVLGPLPPDPLAGVPGPVEVEPGWLAGWLAEQEHGGPDQSGAAPASAPPDRLASDVLAGIEPGVFLAAELESVDPRGEDEYHVVEMVAGYQRIAAWAQHRSSALAARLSRRRLLDAGGQGVEVTAQELAPRLGISRFAARRLVEAGRLFTDRLEDTGIALARGLIDWAKAGVLVRHLADQPADVAWEVQQLVLPDAPWQTVTQLERAVARAIISIDPLRAAARHRAARERRRVDHPRALPDGMASLYAVLPATDAAGLDLALEAAARTARANGDTRTIDQLRADALALLGHGALDHGFIGTDQTPARPPAQGDADGSQAGDEAADMSQAGEGAADTSAGADGAADESQQAGEETGDMSQAADGSADASQGADRAADGSAGASPDVTGTVDTPPRDDAPQPEALGTEQEPVQDRPPGPGTPDDPAQARAQAGAHDPLPGDTATSPQAPPALQTGNSFLRTPHMPIGTIGGRRAQIKVTVPLSVLIPFARLLDQQEHQHPGVSCAHHRDTDGRAHARDTDVPAGEPVDAAAPPPGGPTPAHSPAHSSPATPTTEGASGSEDYDEEGLPSDWYHGPPMEVAELEGYGPITPDVALALAHSGGTWQRLVTDPLSGTLLDVGRTRYRPPAALAQFVRERDGTCIRPGCTIPARSCQLDHLHPWHFGGLTAADNLAATCPAHHATKTLGSFQVHHHGNGTFQWTTPTGHRYLRHHTGRITPLPPIHRTDPAPTTPAHPDHPPF